jgi:TolA-binding protein
MTHRRWIVQLLFVVGITCVLGGCSYFNTFYNAKKQFNAAERETKQRERDSKTTQTTQQPAQPAQPGQPNRPATAPAAASDKYRKVIETSSKLLEYYPNSGWVPDALFLMGVSYYRLADLPRAERKFTELVTLFPKSKLIPEALIWKGRVLIDQKNSKAATDVLLEGLSKTRNSALKAEAYYLLGTTSLEQKNYAEAEGYFKSAYETHPSRTERVDALFRYGMACYEEKKYENARDAFSNVVRLTKEVAQAYQASIYWSKCEVGLAQYDQAESILTRIRGSERFFDYADEVSLELAQLAISVNHVDNGVNLYQDFIANHENGELRGLAFYRLALVHRDHRIDLPLARALLDSVQRSGASKDITDSARIALTQISKGLFALEKIKTLEAANDSLTVLIDSAGSSATDSSLLAYMKELDLEARAKPKAHTPEPSADMKLAELPKLASLEAPGKPKLDSAAAKHEADSSRLASADLAKHAGSDTKKVSTVPAKAAEKEPAKKSVAPVGAGADSNQTWAAAVLVFRSLSLIERGGFRTLVICIVSRDSARDAGDAEQEKKAQTVINRAYRVGENKAPVTPAPPHPVEKSIPQAPPPPKTDSLSVPTKPILSDSTEKKPAESGQPSRSREDSPGGPSPEWLAALSSEDSVKAQTPKPSGEDSLKALPVVPGEGAVIPPATPPASPRVSQSSMAADSILRALSRRDSLKADSLSKVGAVDSAAVKAPTPADTSHAAPVLNPVETMRKQLIVKRRDLQATYLQVAEFYLYNLSEPDSAMRYFRLAAASPLNASVFWRANLYLAYKLSPPEGPPVGEAQDHYRAVVMADSVPVEAANVARQALGMPLLPVPISEQDSLFLAAETARFSGEASAGHVLDLYGRAAAHDSTSKTGMKALVSQAYICEYDLHRPDLARPIYEQLQKMNPDTALSVWVRGKLSKVDSTSAFFLTDEQMMGKTQPMESLLEQKPDSTGWPPPETSLQGRRYR